MTNQEFTDRLNEKMEERGLSNEAVALEIEVAVSTVKRWRAGVCAPLGFVKVLVLRDIGKIRMVRGL